jgi:hypothetical protein
MPGFSYLIPQIFSWPAGHDVVIKVPASLIQRRLRGDAQVRWTVQGTRAGEVRFEQSGLMAFSGEQLPRDLVVMVPGQTVPVDIAAGYLELELSTAEGEDRFSTKAPPGLYALYKSVGMPEYRSDGSLKFGSPVIIASLGAHGRYVEGQPSVWLDRAHNAAESMLFANPYARPILVNVRTHDGRTLPRIRIDGKHARMVSLEPLLSEGEESYLGRLQFSATNRVVAFHARHAWGDQTSIVDQEHCDPYRGDATHIPWSLWIRDRVARKIKQRRAARNMRISSRSRT